jgi:outer membrane protein OmpA-like peptidoglycan-associated protein
VTPPAPLTEEEIFARKSLEQLNAERPLDDVYFDLDQSTVREDAKPRLQKDADWLKRWTSTQITWKATATRAAAPNTTSVWVRAGRRP